MSRLIIVGASGLIGSTLYKRAKRDNSFRSVIGTYCRHPQEGLLPFNMDGQLLRDVVTDLGPDDIVVFAAGIVPQAEVNANPERATAINLDATMLLIEEISDSGAKPIFLSSVDVFRDAKPIAQKEVSTVCPGTLYGTHKMAIESVVLRHRGTVVRSGWVIGNEFKPPCLIKSMYENMLFKAKGVPTYARDVVATLTSAIDLAAFLTLVCHAPSGIYHAASQPAKSYAHLANTVRSISKHGPEMVFRPCESADIGLKPRAWLDSTWTTHATGFHFNDNGLIIWQKVRYLDLQYPNGAS